MAQPQESTPYWVIAPCGAWNQFEDRDTAEDEKRIHESLCDECDDGDCELKNGKSIQGGIPATDD